MNDLEFTFEESPWEGILDELRRGDSLSAVRFLTVMEGESEEAVEDALLDLEMGGVMLDISDLPRLGGTGEAAARLRREEQLVTRSHFWTALDPGDPLRLYLEEVAAMPAFGDPNLLAGKKGSEEQLLNASLHRVVELAREYVGRGVLLLDLIQEGSLGLWQAIQNYEGGDFERISDWWIRFSLSKAVVLQARASGTGQKLRQALEDYRSVDERLLSDLGRNATVAEIAEELHMSEEEATVIRNMLASARLVESARTANQPKEKTEDDERHVEDTAYFQMRQRIMELLSGLSAEDAQLLTLRFGLEGGLPLTPEDTGRRLGLTPEEVVAREATALAQLRRS